MDLHAHDQTHNHANKSKKRTRKQSLKSTEKLPTTVLCGFLGSGKTTLLNYILNNNKGYKVAVIVNDMSEISIDATIIKNGQATLKRTEEKLVELSNGCICCTLRHDLIKEISKLARNKKFDYLLIESTGMAEPLPIAQAFSFENENGKTLNDLAKIDTMVTVVDAFNFYKQLNSIETVKEEIKIGNEQRFEEVPIAQLFIDQVEFANVIIINKIDLVSDEQIEAIKLLISKLNPNAEILLSKNSVVPLEKILMTEKFDFDEAQDSSKWIEELAKAPSSEIQEYGFSSFAFKSRKPFNPTKFHDLMQDKEIFKDVVRAKGYVWVATNMHLCAMMNIVGEIRELNPETIWWAAVKKNKWGETKAERTIVEEAVGPIWDEQYGDRRNEIVFIGKSLNKVKIVDALEKCLITDDEFMLGNEEWKKLFKDPFTEWIKVVKNHPMRENFKEIDGDWEELDTEEEAEEEEEKEIESIDINNNLKKNKKRKKKN